MKRIFSNKITIASIVFLLFALGSCKKFLDQKPITEVSTNLVFNDVSSAQKAIAAVYSRLSGDNGYGIRLSMYFPLDNDETQGPTGSSDNDRRDIARYAATPSNAQITKPFNQLFQGIEYANICIENIPKMSMYSKGSDQQKKQLQRMYGEALALRAQFYFEAIRNWGDLPAHFSAAGTQATSAQFPTRTDHDSLYNRIIADLKTAEDVVPWRNEVSSIGDQLDERLTKGSIKGLRARIALFRGGYSLHQSGSMQRSADYLQFYQIARDETNDIITSAQHSLNPSFKSLWKDQVDAHAIADPQGELMFQVSATGGKGEEDSKLGYYNGPRVNNKGNSSVNPLITYFYLFDSADTRRDVTIVPYFVAGDGVTKIGPGSQLATALNEGKYRRNWITNPSIAPSNAIQYFGLKWQILRYSDVLLMFAEAENEINGPTTAAYDAVNMVRRRGYDLPINAASAIDIPAGLSKSEFFKYIVRERSLELGGEGIRKYDLIRWNLLGTALTESKNNLNRLAVATAMVQPDYMAPMPSYVISSTLPQLMYLKNNSTSDVISDLFANSFYQPSPSSTPAGTTKLTWIALPTGTAPRNAIGTVAADRFATNFTTGKSELLPIPQPARDANFNLGQNPGY